MIVRILGEGQFRVDDDAAAELNRMDAELEAAVERGDEAGLTTTLNGLLGHVRDHGAAVPPDLLEPSELILPHEGSSMDEVRKLLSDDGLPTA
jgi:hypothetical protein